MEYREHVVPVALQGLVECGWTSAAPVLTCVRDVLPDGCMDLVWTGTEILVAGPDTGPHPYRRPGGVAAAGLRFAPGALPALLDVPASMMRDQRVPLGQFDARLARQSAARLTDMVGERPDTCTVVLTELARLATRLPGRAGRPAIRLVATRLAAGATAAAVADALGWTTRSLHRRCLSAFGYGPATLRRVLRFRRATALLHAGVPLADVAAHAGYADQPHLSREVRALAGVAPGQLASGANRSTPLPSGSCTVA